MSDTAPEDNILFSSSLTPFPGNSIQYGRGKTSDRFGGPVFLTDFAGKASSVTFFVSQSETGAPSAPVTLSLVRFKDGPPVTGADSYTEEYYETVWSEHFTLPESIDPERYITFVFSNPVKLEKNETYGFLLHFEKATGKQSINLSSARPKKSGIKIFRTTDNYADNARDGSTYEVTDGNFFFVIQK